MALKDDDDGPVYQLRLPHLGANVAAPAGATLLHALLHAGHTWPAACRNGSCRACMGQLLSGSVHYSVPWPGLLPEEKTSGAVLPCVALPRSDVVLLPPAA